MGHGRSYGGSWNRAATVPLVRPRSKRKSIIVGVLALMAVTQAAFIGNRVFGHDLDEHEIRVGHDLSQVALERADGTEIGLAEGRTTLLLVFDPECVHSGEVAVMWKDWLTAGPRGDRVVALSPGSLPSASAYARDRRWPVEVVSVKTAAGGGVHALTRRSPWVYAVGGDGRVLVDGHGRTLPEVARVLAHNRSIVMRYAGGGG